MEQYQEQMKKLAIEKAQKASAEKSTARNISQNTEESLDGDAASQLGSSPIEISLDSTTLYAEIAKRPPLKKEKTNSQTEYSENYEVPPATKSAHSKAHTAKKETHNNAPARSDPDTGKSNQMFSWVRSKLTAKKRATTETKNGNQELPHENLQESVAAMADAPANPSVMQSTVKSTQKPNPIPYTSTKFTAGSQTIHQLNQPNSGVRYVAVKKKECSSSISTNRQPGNVRQKAERVTATQNKIHHSENVIQKSTNASLADQGKAKAISDAKKTLSHQKAYAQSKKASKAAKKATAHTLKAVKKLPLLLGGVAVFVIVFGGLIGILSTSLGIFVSTGNDNSVRSAVLKINQKFAREIERTKHKVDYDELEIIDAYVDWPEVLSVYAVKAEIDGDEVISMDDKKMRLLEDIFWEMNEITWEAKSYYLNSQEVLSENTDNSENTEPIPTEPPKIVKLTILVTHKSAYEMSVNLGFSDDDNETLSYLLDPENAPLWRELIYGINLNLKNGWVCPLETLEITSPFGYRVHPLTGEWKLHAGVDLAAPQGTPILAIQDGTVTISTYDSSAGNFVKIDHGDGYQSLSMHMLYCAVNSGQAVHAGDIIGYVGSTGSSTGPHLHLGVTYNGKYIDPMQLFVDEEDSTLP